MQILEAVYHDIIEAGGEPVIVGGAVRDHLLGLTPKDVDTEVYGLTPAALRDILSEHGTVDVVGAQFGVYLVTLDGISHEFSLPRRDVRSGHGHRDFEVIVDPFMSFERACRRRDFTINAMMMIVGNGEIIDNVGGREDLRAGIIRHVDTTSFPDDPLRPLRAFRFASRFGFSVAAETIELCRKMQGAYVNLPVERVWGEWRAWAETATRPSIGLQFLRDSFWVFHYPAIDAMTGVPQSPEHHPEGPVEIHVGHVCDAAAEIAARCGVAGEDRIILMLAALCHDMGKPATTVFEREQWRSPGHAESGELVAKSFLISIGCPAHIREVVQSLVREHMFPVWDEVGRAGVRRLKHRLLPATLSQLLLLMEADRNGRPPKPKGLPPGAEQLIRWNTELPPKIEPILKGRHLLGRGFEAGPSMGAVLKRAFEAQLNEEFLDLNGALLWLESEAPVG